MTSALTPQQKIEWAKFQRKQGNDLFAKGDYHEAMDVYLTCLVAMDTSTKPSSQSSSKEEQRQDVFLNEDADSLTQSQSLKRQIESEIQLPVLLNLALCALKMGRYQKAEKFCNFAMDLEAGRTSAKAHFRRGKTRMLMGHYASAALDLDKALELNAITAGRNGKGDGGDPTPSTDVESEREAILRGKQKLLRLVNEAEKNRRRQRKAMELVLGGGANRHDNLDSELSINASSDDNDFQMMGSYDAPSKLATRSQERKASNIRKDFSLYPEKKGPKKLSARNNSCSNTNVDDNSQPTYFEWYLRMIGRCAQKLLDIIGDDNEENIVFQEGMGREFMKAKKNS